MKHLRVIVAALVGLSGSVLPSLADTPVPLKLTFGVVPQQSATDLAQVWTPLLAYLSGKTGYTLEFRTAQDTSTFERRLATGDFDFIYANPLQYTNARTSGYLAVARERDTQLVGIVVVSKDSRYKNLKDLDGATMAFPSPSAFAATIVTQLSLKQLGVSVTPRYVTSHDSVYLTVARGLYPAGGGILKTYEQVDPPVRDKVRILWKSRSYTSHPVAVHARVAAEAAQRVTTALLAMADDQQGVALLQGAGFKGFIPAKDSDYEDIRKLQVNIGHADTDTRKK